MIYLSGAIREELRDVRGAGFMLTPNMGNRPDVRAIPWGADTGCFGTRYVGDDAYLRWLDTWPRDACLFALAPDVVGDWQATVARSAPMLPRIRALGYSAGFVLQDGMPVDALDWDAFDCLFVGGSTGYKLSEAAYAIVAEARRRGKWAHMGRVNSLRRLRAAAVSGYGSADGTFLTFGPDKNLPRVAGWLAAVNAPRLIEWEETA